MDEPSSRVDPERAAPDHAEDQLTAPEGAGLDSKTHEEEEEEEEPKQVSDPRMILKYVAV